jgi:galactokinase/mevalonate kinase-like predicted kinase
LVPIGPREGTYDVFQDSEVTPAKAAALAAAAESCWQAILRTDLREFGQWMRQSFEAQVALFPQMNSPAIEELIRAYAPRALGWKLSGAGGGGYLVLVSEKPLEGTLKLTIRRKNF